MLVRFKWKGDFVMKLKRITVFLSLFVFMFLFFYCSVSALAGGIPLRGFYKTDYKTEDTVSKGLEPNVLFLLDTSTAMTFTVGGIMPNENDHRSIWERAKTLKNSTYGHGLRPPIIDNVESTKIYGGSGIMPPGHTLNTSHSRYGRDMDSTNNVIGNPDCYYTSDPNKPFLLTFRNRHLAHYDKWISSNGTLTPPSFGIVSNLPNSGVVGTLTGSDWTNAVASADEAYKALRDYIPTQYVKDTSGNWVAAPGYVKGAVSKELADKYLVPNDSRLYKMKLALWRLTDKANSNVFSRMNVGVAITYQDISTYLGANSLATKTKSEDSKVGEKHREYFGATETFPFGNAASYVTGVTGATTDIEGVAVEGTYMSQWAKRGVWVGLYKLRKRGDPLWNAASRSIMYAPFNKFYVTDSKGNTNKTEQFDNFRKYISGYEEYKGLYNINNELVGAVNKPVKDEFWATSLTLLSTSIYGGRDSSEGSYFPYHKGINITDSDSSLKPTNEPMIQFAVAPRTNAGSTNDFVIFLDPSTNTEGLPTGQAVGSVLDFFSPPETTNSTNGLDGVRFDNSTIGFFPVTGSCQSNWLVIFCAGNDSIPGNPPYPPADAVKKLFNTTRKMRGRNYDGSKWIEQNYDMDSGVRTLVVGFLPDEDKNEELEIAKVRSELKEMAKAGDPILTPTGYISNPHAEPEIAKDVPGLVRAFNSVLKRIYVEKMGSGTVSLPPVIDNITDPGTRIVFGAAYKINPLDQWNGWLGKYKLINTGSVEQWEANNLMVEKGSKRALYTFSASASGSEEVLEVASRTLEESAGVSNEYSGEFSKWLLDYGHNSGIGESVGILGDMVNSGITVVWKPKHKDLASNNAINNREAVVYIQTNRGVLHSLNYTSGYEIWGFIPPNVFQHKLKNLKFDGSDWIEGNGFTRAKSNPMVLLDGMLIARDVESQRVVRTYLTGYHGYGGNGFYTMDITEGHAAIKPVFVWAIENARYGEAGYYSISDRVKRWGAAAQVSESYYDYTDLGLTIVPGVYFTPAKYSDTVGVLPGGLGHKVGVDDTQGKAFYVFNPSNGSIMRKIDSGSNSSAGFEAPIGRKLGMGVSPIIYHENSEKKAIAFYTADSEGNIFKCDIEEKTLQNWKLKSIFQLRTLSGGDPVAIPKKMILAKARTDYLWLFGGTSDLYAPGSDNDDSKKIINSEQFIFGLNTTNILDSNELNSGITPSHKDIRKLKYYSDGIPGIYGNYGEAYSYGSELGINYGMKDYGWVLKLRPKIDNMAEAEYLSAEPYLMNNVLYIATFIPYAGSKSEEACSDVGTARLYALDPSTGLSVIKDKPAIALENLKIAGLSGNPSANRLVLSVKELSPGAATRGVYENFTNVVDISNNSLFEVGAPGGSSFNPGGGNELNFEEIIPHVQYWRERF
jgi:hypothetical protein